MIEVNPDTLRDRFTGAYRAITDRHGEYGSVRWFARQCEVNETTVWAWLRDGRAPRSALDKLEALEELAREAVDKRLREEVDAAKRKAREVLSLMSTNFGRS